MSQYWIAALNLTEAEQRDGLYQTVKSRVGYQTDEMFKFDVPMNLTFKSFDSLIKLVDDLQKNDPQVEATLRRVEKQLREFSENPEFAVVSRQRTYTWRKYMQEFQWDDAKYPKTRSIAENLALMMTTVNKLDEEVRTKMASLADTRGTLAALAKDSNNYATADLIDLLTPKNTKAEDFVETEHLTTVVVVVPKNQDKDFLAAYETIDNFVVPETALQLNVAPDKDGATLYRVVLFKKSVPMFRQAIGSAEVAKGGKRFIVRDFTFSAEQHREYEARRTALQKDAEKQETMGKMVCKAAFADMFLSWMHIKAMRTFVESVLRYGVGNQGTPNFMAFMLKVPSQARQQQGLRSALAELVGAKGQSHDDEGEDFYPYVSLAMQPLSQD